MAQAHRLDCEKQAADCRFVIQSENETEAIALAKSHMREAHGREFTDDELRRHYVETV